jgi:rhamnosyltransferase
MNNKKVAVIMSTYNGEKFVKEQLDSILNQTYKNIEIVIRDDGSKDSTVEIIKEYKKKYNNITLYEGENLGFIKSFFELLKLAEADYYSYADQDDIWIENKIELAVNSLNSLDDTKPNMAFGNSDYYDENMKFIGNGEKNKKYSFLSSLFSCVTQGMTMTVNKVTRDMIIENTPKTCFFHDWWTYILCVSLGNVAYDNVTTVKYRRRKENATSEGQGYFRLLVWRFKHLIFGDGMSNIKQQMINFKDYYYYELSDENKKILDLFSAEGYDFKRALQKAFYGKRIRRNLIDDIMLRVIFLIGVL